mmetsp:Transcript_5060/g.12072  ORF Transcript_5060/g.12072 Transcript_5060/m.12072 type:complete len:206 (+) Transcript_5060:307-924(+)
MILPRPLSPTFETSSAFSSSKVTILSQNVMLQVPTIKVPPRRVSFSSDENDSQSAPHKELTSEMIQDIWYNAEEMRGFKKQAKSIILQRYQQPQTAQEEETDENALGLERYEPKRDEFRRAAIFYTVQAQNKSKDPEFIRLIAHKCTDFARAAAVHQGMKDFAAAYYPLFSLDTQGNNNKRQQQCNEESCTQQPPAKKQRMVCVA